LEIGGNIGHSLCIVGLAYAIGLSYAVAETWRRVWGDEKIFSADPGFLNDVFG